MTITKSKINNDYKKYRGGANSAAPFICENKFCDNQWSIYSIDSYNKISLQISLCDECVWFYNKFLESQWSNNTYQRIKEYLEEKYWRKINSSLRDDIQTSRIQSMSSWSMPSLTSDQPTERVERMTIDPIDIDRINAYAELHSIRNQIQWWARQSWRNVYMESFLELMNDANSLATNSVTNIEPMRAQYGNYVSWTNITWVYIDDNAQLEQELS